MTRVKTVLNCEWAHLERQRGSDAQASSYGMKEDTRVEGPWEYGELATQGKRFDIIKVIDLVKSKRSFSDIANECPSEWIRMSRGIKEFANTINKSVTRLNLEVIVLKGSAGTGKTRWCFDNYPDLYRVNLGSANMPVWWDGYETQRAVLFDDFCGQSPITELLNYLDIYPMQGRVKGGFVQLHYTIVMITTNVSWEQWYPFLPDCQKRALKRRIHLYCDIDDGDSLPPSRIDRHLLIQ